MKRIGVFAGSFNPFHIGHQNILDQTKKIFNEVIVIRGYNNGKSMLDHLESKDPVKWNYRGLLTDQLNQIEKQNKKSIVTLIRGLRDSKDLEYEQQQLFFLKELKPDLNCIFIVCDPEYRYISSSSIRILADLKQNISKYLK